MEVGQVVMYWDGSEGRWCPSEVLELDQDDDEITLDVDYHLVDGYESSERLSSLEVRTDVEGLVWLRGRAR